MNRYEEFHLTPHERALAAQQRRRRYLLIGGLIVFLMVSLFAARPVVHSIKGWQARRHAAKAFEFIAAENWSEASREARAAVQLRAQEPDALRAVGRLLSRTRLPGALSYWKELREKATLTRDDLRDEAAAALLEGENTAAENALAQLLGPKAGGPAPADWLLAARWSAQLGRRDQVAEYVAKIAADHRSRERELFQASLFQIAATTGDAPGASESRAAAWTRLTRSSRTPNSCRKRK